MEEQKPKDDERPDERNPAFERFEDLAKRLLKVPKEEREKREQEKKQAG